MDRSVWRDGPHDLNLHIPRFVAVLFGVSARVDPVRFGALGPSDIVVVPDCLPRGAELPEELLELRHFGRTPVARWGPESVHRNLGHRGVRCSAPRWTVIGLFHKSLNRLLLLVYSGPEVGII